MSIEAEWNAFQSEVVNEVTDVTTTLQGQGFHVTLASFLTGETVRGREAVRPVRPFDPRCGGWGAWEAYGRYSYLRFGDELFAQNLADPTEWTDEVSMTDIGINWYPNAYTKFYFDWQHAAYASPVLVNAGSGALSNSNDLYWARCQVYF